MAEQLDDSEKSLKLYLLTHPSEKDAREAQDRIYALSAKKKLALAGVEKDGSPTTKAVSEKDELRRVLRQANNRKFVAKSDNIAPNGDRWIGVVRVSGDELSFGFVVGVDSSGIYKFNQFVQTFKVKPTEFEFESPVKAYQCERGDRTRYCTAKVSISRDGRTIKLTQPIEEYSQVLQLQE